MNTVSEDYIRDLEPETLRYDVTLEEDFVISVLPNGIKTWAFLYEYKGRQRRKTLGVYPDMSHVQAVDALRNARSMIERLDGDAGVAGESEDGAVHAPPPSASAPQRPAILATGYRRHSNSHQRRHKGPGKWPGNLLLALLGAIALGTLLYVLTRPSLESEIDATRSTAPTARDRTGADTPGAKEETSTRSNPFALSNQPAADDKQKDEVPPPAQPADSPKDESGSSGDPGRTEVEPIPVSARTGEPDTSRAGVLVAAVGAIDGAPPPAVNPARAADPEPAAVDVTGDAPSTPIAAITPDSHGDPSPPAERSATRQANVTTVIPPPKGATASGGSVARAIVTSGVENLEPVDDLGDWVVLRNNGYQSIFFFTELRDFSAGDVIHRWEYNGRILADVPLRVAKSWRWRTYSSKDLLPGMTGDWSISVIDSRGDILATRSFKFDRE